MSTTEDSDEDGFRCFECREVIKGEEYEITVCRCMAALCTTCSRPGKFVGRCERCYDALCCMNCRRCAACHAVVWAKLMEKEGRLKRTGSGVLKEL